MMVYIAQAFAAQTYFFGLTWFYYGLHKNQLAAVWWIGIVRCSLEKVAAVAVRLPNRLF